MPTTANYVPVMSSGYAYSSLRSLENVMIGQDEAANAKFVHYCCFEGREHAKFRIGKKYYWQLTTSLKLSPVRMFDTSDVNESGHIYASRDELLYAPTEWQKRGLTQTATGYGSKLNSGLMIHFAGKYRRLYVTCYSNSGTTWFMFNGRRIVVS